MTTSHLRPIAPSSPGDGVVGGSAGTAEEVAAVFARYERALREADVAVLTELFWDDPRCVRYGVDDRQHGAAEIAAWRREHPGVPPGRTLSDTVVLALGEDAAVVSTLFGYPGRAAEGRQTQTWARTADGWRIVAAHVSETGALRAREQFPVS